MFFSPHPSTLNSQPSTILKCCTWHGNVAPGSRHVAPGKRSEPLILLVCYDVAPGNVVFRRAPGGNVTWPCESAFRLRHCGDGPASCHFLIKKSWHPAKI